MDNKKEDELKSEGSTPLLQKALVLPEQLWVRGALCITEVPLIYTPNFIFNLLRCYGNVDRIIRFIFTEGNCHYLVVFQTEDDARSAYCAMLNPPGLASRFKYYFIPSSILYVLTSFMTEEYNFCYEVVYGEQQE